MQKVIRELGLRGEPLRNICNKLEHMKQSVNRLESTVDSLQNMLLQKRRRKVCFACDVVLDLIIFCLIYRAVE